MPVEIVRATDLTRGCCLVGQRLEPSFSLRMKLTAADLALFYLQG